jgi:Cu-Zn family superoxide dismutase
MFRLLRTLGLSVALLPFMTGSGHAQTTQPAAQNTMITKAIATIYPTQGNNARGTVVFTQEAGGVRVVVTLSGLPPGEHGLHIHEFGDASAPDGTSAGGHFNPTARPHAGPDDMERHAGDLGNVTADASGNASVNRLDTHLTLSGAGSIIGRGVVVHEKVDDLKSQPTGNAGGRIGIGVIGVAKN